MQHYRGEQLGTREGLYIVRGILFLSLIPQATTHLEAPASADTTVPHVTHAGVTKYWFACEAGPGWAS